MCLRARRGINRRTAPELHDKLVICATLVKGAACPPTTSNPSDGAEPGTAGRRQRPLI
jgi:hypothetical protein